MYAETYLAYVALNILYMSTANTQCKLLVDPLSMEPVAEMPANPTEVKTNKNMQKSQIADLCDLGSCTKVVLSMYI